MKDKYDKIARLISFIGSLCVIICIMMLCFSIISRITTHEKIEKPKKNIFLTQCIHECSDYIHFKIIKEEDVKVAIFKYENGKIHSVYCNCDNKFEKRIW